MTATLTAPRVLVVDPDSDVAADTAVHLRFAGFPSRACHDGVGAVLAAYDFRPDVAVVPLDAPGVDSTRLAGHLRGWAMSAGRPLVLVALADDPGPAADRRAAVAGFDLVLGSDTAALDLAAVIDGLWREWAPAARRAQAAAG